MAVTSIWPIKGRVDQVINYARNPEKTTDGEKGAVFHGEPVPADGKGHLLPVSGRVAAVVGYLQVPQGDPRCRHRQGEGAEGAQGPTHFVHVPGPVPEDDPGPVRPRARQGQAGGALLYKMIESLAKNRVY